MTSIDDRAERDRRYAEGELPWPISAEEWQRAAADAMEPREFDYVAGGAGAGSTVRANLEAFARVRLRPRMLVPNEQPRMEVELLGARAAAPVLAAPVGVLEMAHPDREPAVARAFKAMGLPLVLSTQASTSMEDVAAELDDHPRWFQLYWGSDREVVASHLKRAEDSGYGAIVLTVDTQMVDWRDRDIRNAFLPFAIGKGVANYASDPVFRARMEASPDDLSQVGLEMIRIFPNLGLGWDDLSWLRAETELPIVLKGILRGDDASRAREAGVDGVIVSNHGGRQVDGAIASLDALPEVREAFGDGPVLVDGGVRRGPDVVKALALGADAVLIGRPYLFALATAGEAGVVRYLGNLLAELQLTLSLCGVTDVGEVSPDLVAR